MSIIACSQEITDCGEREGGYAPEENTKVEQLTHPSMNKPRLLTFGDAYTAYKANGGKLRNCKPVLDAFGDMPVEHLTQALVDAEAHRRYAGKERSTVRRQFFVPLLAITNFATHRGLCTALSIKGPPQEPRRSKVAILHPTDAQRIAAVCAPHFLALFLFLYLSGAEAGEAVTLDWKQVDLPRRRVLLRKPNRSVPLHPYLYDALLRLPHRKGRVFRHRSGKAYVDRGNGGASIRDVFGRACDKAGISHRRVCDLRSSWAAVDFAKHRNFRTTLDRGGWAEEASIRWLKKLSAQELDDLQRADALWGQSQFDPGFAADEAGEFPATATRQKATAADSRRAWPRLLTPQDAARYCSLSTDRFRSICPVPVIELGESKRLHRYDRFALDEWIDKLIKQGNSSTSDWLGLVEPRHAGNSRQRNQEGPRTGKNLSLPPPDDDTAQG